MRLLVAALPLVLFVAPAGAGSDVVANGSFEQPAVPADDVDGGIVVASPAVLPGDWRVTGGAIDIVQRAGQTPFQVVEGVQAIDLNGNGLRGTISRTLDLPLGSQYRLSFWVAGNPTCEQEVKRLTVILQGTFFSTILFDTRGRTPQNMGWSYHELSFPGPGVPIDLIFQSISGTECGPMIDDVRVALCLRIVGQPEPVAVCVGAAAEFVVAAEAAADAPAQYRWRRDGMPLSDGGAVSGAHTPTLRIEPVGAGDAGSYSCLVFNDCGEYTSAAAVLAVTPPPCPGDANGDSAVNFSDVSAVLQFWGFEYEGTGTGDPNCDGTVTFSDVTEVLTNWGGACG